ncbi:zinc finger protein [Aphelenchoides avenae]|nr:zinc finger protein [Aphelenchus avenae]
MDPTEDSKQSSSEQPSNAQSIGTADPTTQMAEGAAEEPKDIRWIEQSPTKEGAEHVQPPKDVETRQDANGAQDVPDDRQPETDKEPLADIPTSSKEARKYTFVDSDGEECAEPKRSSDMVKDENGFEYYRCRFCGLTYNYMTTLKAHERSHGVVQPYLCNKCGESFDFMVQLEYHAKQHDKQKGYKCECGRTFYQYTDLLYHRHPGEEPPQPPPLPQPEPSVRRSATLDPSEFPTPQYMEQGFEPKHPLKVYSEVRSKPYICQYCSKSYANSRDLAYHMYSHRGERNFNPRASRYLMCRNDYSYITPGAD